MPLASWSTAPTCDSNVQNNSVPPTGKSSSKWARWWWGLGVTNSGDSLKATACPPTDVGCVPFSSGESKLNRVLRIWWWHIRRSSLFLLNFAIFSPQCQLVTFDFKAPLWNCCDLPDSELCPLSENPFLEPHDPLGALWYVEVVEACCTSGPLHVVPGRGIFKAGASSH